jgi:arylsulfatase A-like enzyme
MLVVFMANLYASRPNILFIFTDDHATQAISAYGGMLADIAPTPNLDRLAEEGMLFRKAYVTNSICGPARAVIQTGKYSHLNGFRRNGDRFDGSQPTAPKYLQKGGYQTAIVGKWHLASTPTGYDHFEVLKGQGAYYNPMLITNGKNVNHVGYTTDIITEQSLDWLENKRDPDKPFLLMVQHKAPHGRWEPAIRHLELFDDIEMPEPSTLFDDYSGREKPISEHKARMLEDMNDHRLMIKYSSKHTPEQLEPFDAYFRPRNEAMLAANLDDHERTKWNYQRYIKNYLRCVKAVDESIGELLGYLDENGLAENTIVIYSSDQGFYLGEHGLFDKRWMYEESLRTPLIVRWPDVVKPGTVNDTDIVSNLDFAETFLDVAGLKIPKDMQGHSLVPVLQGKTPSDWRKYHYYHYYENGGHGVPIHFGVTDGRFKLIRYPLDQHDTWEFFDLKTDPMEMKSIYGQQNPEVQQRLARELQRLRKQFDLPEDEQDGLNWKRK